MLPSELPDVRGVISVDTESDGLFADDGAWVSSFQIAWTQGDVVVEYAWPFCQDPDRPELSDLYNLPRCEYEALLSWLAARDGLAFHNAPHDLGIIGAGTGRWPGRNLLPNTEWDTAIVQRALEPTESAALADIETRVLGGATSKVDLKKALESHLRKRKIGIKRYGHADWAILEPYARGDAALTARLVQHQVKELAAQPELLPWVANDLRVMKTLVRMEQRGLPYDAPRSFEIADQLSVACARLADRLPFEPKPAAARDWFFGKKDNHYADALAQPLKLTTVKGEACIDAETVEMLAAADVEGARDYQEWCRASNAISKWYQAFAEATGKDGRLRCRFKQSTVRSGRLAVGRINLQAIPQDYVLKRSPLLSTVPSPRALIQAPPGWALWEMDLAQAELRVAALWAGCEPMIEIIEQGRDPHGELSAATFNVQKGDEDWFQYRQVAKRANFSLLFAIGHETLRADIRKQTGLDLGERETKRLIKVWRGLYPQFGRAIKYWQNRAEIQGHVTLINGRHSYFADYERSGLHKAFNRVVQGSIGAFAQEWMVQADHLLMDKLNGQEGLLLMIHDSLLIHVPDGPYGEGLANEVKQLGLDLWPRWFTRPDNRTIPGDLDLRRWEHAH